MQFEEGAFDETHVVADVDEVAATITIPSPGLADAFTTSGTVKMTIKLVRGPANSLGAMVSAMN